MIISMPLHPVIVYPSLYNYIDLFCYQWNSKEKIETYISSTPSGRDRIGYIFYEILNNSSRFLRHRECGPGHFSTLAISKDGYIEAFYLGNLICTQDEFLKHVSKKTR